MQYYSLGRTWQSARQGKIYYPSRMRGSAEQSRVFPTLRPQLLPSGVHWSCSTSSSLDTSVSIADYASSWAVRHNSMLHPCYSHRQAIQVRVTTLSMKGEDQSSGLKGISRLRQLLIAINGSMNQHANLARMPDAANLKLMSFTRQPVA